MPQLRLFVALDLPPAVKAMVAGVQAELERMISPGTVRWADPTGAHLTLKYLGLTDGAAQIQAELDRIGPHVQPFGLATGAVGTFPQRGEPRILWLGVGGDLPAVVHLQELVEGRIAPLGFPSEARGFTPHITLGRTRQGQRGVRPAGLAAVNVPAQSWMAETMVLMVSEPGPQGTVYRPIHTVRFDDPR